MKRMQQKIWHNEHLFRADLPSLAMNKPSGMVVKFIEWLCVSNIDFNNKKVVDIGCGKGRNSIYLAQQGFDVRAFDYIDIAIEHATKKAGTQGVSKAVTFSVAAMDERWPFEDNYFDFGLDCFSSIDIETREGRITYKNELLRTLKPGGYALVCVVAAHDEFEQKLIQQHPGKEKHSSLWPGSGKFQKNYDEQELRDFYAEFNIISLQEVNKKAFKLNTAYQASNYWLLLQKSEEKI